jgi:uncharacterized protein (TIGR03083 family)
MGPGSGEGAERKGERWSVGIDRELVFAAVSEERRRIADIVARLDDTQLATPTLCAGWDVKTVAAHVVSTVEDGLWVFLRQAARRGSLASAIDELARRRARLPTTEIIHQLRQCAERRVSPPLFGPLDPLADVLVHRGDISIPLGLHFAPSPRLAALALDFLAGRWPIGFVPWTRLRGISLRSTDISRRWRTGVEVSGPAAALMMAVAGRTAQLDLLEGPGLPLLRNRLRCSNWQ